MQRLVPVLAVSIAMAFGQVQAAENVMTGEPTAEDFIEALSPPGGPPRGIRPKEEAEPAPAPEVSLPMIHFGFDSAELTPEARSVLDELAAALRSRELGGSRFLIEGHTDAVGSAAYNRSLSEERARAVRRYLAAQEVDPARLETLGKGEEELLEPTEGAARINRRVRVVNLGGG